MYENKKELSVSEILKHLLNGNTICHGKEYNLEFKLVNDSLVTNGFNPNLTANLIFNKDIKFKLKDSHE